MGKAAVEVPQTRDAIGSIVAVLALGVWWAKPLAVFGRACFAANKISLKGSLHSFAGYAAGAFGGGFIVPVLLGSPPSPLATDLLLLSAAVAFCLNLWTAGTWQKLYTSPLGTVIGLVLEAMFRGNLVVTLTSKAADTLGASLIGPVVCGTLAGVGGMFFPLNKGLAALDDGVVPPAVLQAGLTAAFAALASDPAKHGMSIDALDASTIAAVAVFVNGAYDVSNFLMDRSKASVAGKNTGKAPAVATSLLWATAVVLAGAAGFVVTEEHEWVDAVYLAGITLTTVGYGDITPSTGAGKAWAVVIMLGGMGAFARAYGQTFDFVKSKVPASVKNDGMKNALANLTGAVVVGGLVMAGLEDWDAADGMYWAVVTSTSVGYGDLAPASANGKLFTVVYSLYALGSTAEVVAYLNGKLDALVEGALSAIPSGKSKKL